jgi:hypothetical protein
MSKKSEKPETDLTVLLIVASELEVAVPFWFDFFYFIIIVVVVVVVVVVRYGTTSIESHVRKCYSLFLVVCGLQ